MDFYKGTIPIIHDDAESMAYAMPGADGNGNAIGYGYVPRDFKVDPPEMFSPLTEIEIIPESEWDARYDEGEVNKSTLEHVFLPSNLPAFVNLDQNGNGYCWAYSTGHALMMARLRENQATVRLNPHSVAAIIKGGRDEGGWCGLSAKFARETGYAEEGTGPGQWPLHSRNLKYDTPECRAQMARFRTTEEFVDLTRNAYDQNLARNQLATCLFNNLPCPTDFNWWGHSVCSVRWVRIERGSWGLLILNSWLGWGRHGLGVLQGSKARTDGALCIRTATISG